MRFAPRRDWHAEPAATVAAAFAVDPKVGLDAMEAARRRHAVGANRLREPDPIPLWSIFLRQFAGALPAILGIAAIIAYAVGDTTDAVAILFVLALNGVLGFVQERRAEKSLAALRSMLAEHCRVRRPSGVADTESVDLVPGDIVIVESGDRIPADGRLVESHLLSADESVLTGESVPADKHADGQIHSDAPIGDRRSMLYMNTVVTRGRGMLLVTETGGRTEVGRIAEMLGITEETATPLQRQLDRLGKRLAIVALGATAVILAVSLARGTPPFEALLLAITLAVAAVPEGLPAVVTVTLAIGMNRLAGRGAIVKRLSAVETLGCATVICSDKTGTLTMNEMTACALVLGGERIGVSGSGYGSDGIIAARADDPVLARTLLAIRLCNDARLNAGKVIGDPTEGALIALAAKGGINDMHVETLPRVAEIPFDAGHRFMATVHRDEDGILIAVKGAPDIVAERAKRIAGLDGDRPMTAALRASIDADADALANDALRVIGVAERRVSEADFAATEDVSALVSELTFLGLVGMEDPVRPEAIGAVEACRRAGIAVKMITGDHLATAKSVGRQLSLEGEAVLGAEIDGMTDETLAVRIDGIAVFARVRPETKLKIVDALRRGGHVVAMTGDGVNDAPALKSADIGTAMGIAGTEVSKEAATMVLTDDNFATIVAAVEEGRTIYANIVKFVRYQLSTNFGALLTVFAATVIGLAPPFTPLQLLWVNVIMDGPPAMALGLDPATRGRMHERPRPADTAILSMRRLAILFYLGTLMTVGTLGVFIWAGASGPPERAATMAFTTFVLFQVCNALNARSERRSIFAKDTVANPMLLLSFTVVVALQAIAVHWPPAQPVMRTVALAPADWMVCGTVATGIVVFEEARKFIQRALSH
ncbi:MAG: HAD-IC family P-type ATPase [Proteobacteria bacterium]|nr:HAD-IC family P-type ATPase [Pseudomonadota bacterium]